MRHPWSSYSSSEAKRTGLSRFLLSIDLYIKHFGGSCTHKSFLRRLAQSAQPNLLRGRNPLLVSSHALRGIGRAFYLPGLRNLNCLAEGRQREAAANSTGAPLEILLATRSASQFVSRTQP